MRADAFVQEPAVGRGRPPKHSQFKPGRSGNPRGRPKRSKNIATLLETELNAPVKITENGKTVTLSKRELVVKQAVNKAAAGDPRMLMQLMKAFGGSVESVVLTGPIARSALGDEHDQELLQTLLQNWSADDETE